MSHANYALLVTMQALPGKEADVAGFLRSALPLVQAEAGTLTWYALQLSPDTFGIFDSFADEAGRDTHLAGEVAKLLMAKAPELFAAGPEIRKVDLLATK